MCFTCGQRLLHIHECRQRDKAIQTELKNYAHATCTRTRSHSIDIIPYGTGLEAHHVISFNLYICARRTPPLSERVKFCAETREKRETVLLVYWPYYHNW